MAKYNSRFKALFRFAFIPQKVIEFAQKSIGKKISSFICNFHTKKTEHIIK